MYDLNDLKRSPASRRAFLATMTAAGLGLAASRLLAGDFTPTPSAIRPEAQHTTYANEFPGIPGNNADEIVGNFALTLEILEADLYRQALNQASGFNIHDKLNGGNPGVYRLAVSAGGLSTGEAQAAFTYLVQFTFVEAAHRDFLTAALQSLGSPMVVRHPGGYAFPGGPGSNLKSIMAKILPLEETGVRAYLGALPFVGDLAFAQTAGTIYSTEARHSAAISAILGIDPGPNPEPGDMKVAKSYPSFNTFEYFLEPKTVLQKAAVFFR